MKKLGKGISHIPWEDISLVHKALPEVKKKKINMQHKNESDQMTGRVSKCYGYAKIHKLKT